MIQLMKEQFSYQELWFEPRQVNLHTHSSYCHHGGGSLLDHVRAARDKNLSVLGFSEHAPLPTRRWGNRMDYTEMPKYFEELDSLYDTISPLVLRAMECDYLPSLAGYYQEEIFEQYHCDYLIGAVHFVHMPGCPDISIHDAPISATVLRQYANQYISMLQSGLFLFGAHPDVFGCSYLTWDCEAASCARDILAAASSLHIPLEINANGFRRPKVGSPTAAVRPYPIREFWELATAYDVQVVINSDAHYPEHLDANYEDCFVFARQLGLAVCGLYISCCKEDGRRKLRYVACGY